MKHVSRFLAMVLLITASAAAAETKPNIVLILADDLGYADVSFNGRKEWSTPNLHRLAQDGTVFRRWYTAGVVCAPSRAALMTGRYGIHNGVTGNSSLDLPLEEVTIAEALKARGYATGLFGKWHHGAPRPGRKGFTHPMDQGFDEFFGFVNAVHAWQKFPTELWEGRELKPSQGYADTLFADRAIDFIRRHRGEPFFLYVPFIATHGNVGAPSEEIEPFKGKFKEADPNKPLLATYAAEVVRLDKEIGRILKTLDQYDLAANTIVIFSSDHGATFEKMEQGTTVYFDSNRPFRGQKRTLWEGGMRVPAVVRWPGKVPARGDSHEIIHNCDVFPTLLSAAGGEPDPKWNIDGHNMLDVWTGKAKAPDRILFWEWREGGDVQYAAMHGDLKIVISGGNKPELFNVEDDPAERRELNALHPGEVKRMNDALQAWLATESDAARQRRTGPTTSTRGAEE
jgi:arylsulfatase A-like enzyme